MTFRFSVSLAALALTASVAGPVSADEAGPVVDLETITVEGESPTGPVRGYVAQGSTTGSKTGTPLAETAQSVSVVTRDQMNQQNVQSLNEALRLRPVS